LSNGALPPREALAKMGFKFPLFFGFPFERVFPKPRFWFFDSPRGFFLIGCYRPYRFFEGLLFEFGEPISLWRLRRLVHFYLAVPFKERLYSQIEVFLSRYLSYLFLSSYPF